MNFTKPKRMTPTEREISLMSEEAVNAEYLLILEKKSNLSSMKRQLVIEKFHVLQAEAENTVSESISDVKEING